MQNDIFSARTNNYIKMATTKWADRMSKIIQDEMPDGLKIFIGYHEIKNKFCFRLFKGDDREYWETKNFDAGLKKLLKIAFEE